MVDSTGSGDGHCCSGVLFRSDGLPDQGSKSVSKDER